MKRRKFIQNTVLTTTFGTTIPFSFSCGKVRSSLETSFQFPPNESHPWVFWFWINGNISKESITADLEAMKEVGVGGVIWMEVSGSYWAPKGSIKSNSPEWHEAFQWAISESKRLELQFNMTFNFGYGCGGPWITPENSMQKLIWTETVIDGGKKKSISLKKPTIDRSKLESFEKEWFRPDEPMNPEVRNFIDNVDSYKDVAVLALPLQENEKAANYRIPQLEFESGLKRDRDDSSFRMYPYDITTLQDALLSKDKVIDITKFMDRNDTLNWDAPKGKWQIIRFGHASNLQLTRPCPGDIIGLECDRLSKKGIDSHYDAFTKKIIEECETMANSFPFVHIDSWEAHGQNWTSQFPEEFKRRRGYSLISWLPVLSGRIIDTPELSSRFMYDFRLTVSEMILDNFVSRFKQLLKPHNINLSIEAYGNMAIDNLAYAGIADIPVSEFFPSKEGEIPVTLDKTKKFYLSNKAMSSAAHTYGKAINGCEAWSSDRGWRDHPFTLKAIGDMMFCKGVNKMIGHLSAHQPYENMVPGLTHRKWGMHFNRFNTWWFYSRPWNDYLARCQLMLQKGEFVADILYWFGEGSPINVVHMDFQAPSGYDFDYVSTEIVKQIQVKKGMLTLPSGMTYRYLLLPDDERITLSMMKKVKELVDAGAKVIAQKRFTGSPSLVDYPEGDEEIKKIADDLYNNHRIIYGKTVTQVLTEDKLSPDFSGRNLNFIHRRTQTEDIFFIANTKNERIERVTCTFRVSSKIPELWDPETGKIQNLPEYYEEESCTSIPIDFEPFQSWFVVFRKTPSINRVTVKSNFLRQIDLYTITGSWLVKFDQNWSRLREPVVFDDLIDWSKHPNPEIQYFSGTASYRKNFEFTQKPESPIFLDLGNVQIIARVRVNEEDCGIAWKPPYRVDITSAIREGNNILEIDVVNTWVNRLIGDEQLPLDSEWKDWETLDHWPKWFLNNEHRSSGRFTFTSCRHYNKNSKLTASGLLSPVKLISFT